ATIILYTERNLACLTFMKKSNIVIRTYLHQTMLVNSSPIDNPNSSMILLGTHRTHLNYILPVYSPPYELSQTFIAWLKGTIFQITLHQATTHIVRMLIN